MHGKSIELFLANGTADSIVTAELSNWNGKAIKIPRIEISDCTRKDLQEPGVYFLFVRTRTTMGTQFTLEKQKM